MASTVPHYALTYYVFVPTYVIGALISSWILITLLRGRHHLLTDRLSHCLFAILLVDLLFCLVQFTKYAVLLHATESTLLVSRRVIAGFNFVSWLAVWAANLCLATERYFVLATRERGGEGKYFVGMVVPLVVVALPVTVATSTCSNFSGNIIPAQSPQFEIVFSLMLFGFCYTVAVTISLYVFGYFAAKRDLVVLKEPFRRELERKMRLSLTLMASFLFICYIPMLVYVLLPEGVRQQGWVTFIALELVALDTIVNPLLILHFTPKIRGAVLSCGS
ncbi:hypothetical protein HDU98_004819 [Podochytrium sp. JEL0797]|nr:hypothetical protein HDU98_004819 [Podochytrium sp. JEL0797]